ncbi:hypothetical protein D7231_34825 [Streptomyces klenkii]|uniref:TauD/TfdA-like domain-containing protein n=1 Tax=Streptomyces klenkii TaxID=1420899 RepID=A0A3B0A6E1_9ACTN|nr:hypothetical protein D7231_34825 [Streptomyces klenkii]
MLDLAAQCLRLIPHRDSEPDGLTVIQDSGHPNQPPGFAGFSNQALPVHTERSGTPEPPRLMLFVCARPAKAGGAIRLADGRAVHTDLAHQRPDAATALADPRAALFGGADGVFAPVFAWAEDNRLTLRLRQDQLVRWNPLAAPHLAHLRAAIARHQQRLELAAGEGYLLDNHRWLHGRDGFRGERVAYRALGTARFPLDSGFRPRGAASPPRVSPEYR